jgi:antitoxin FitA
MSKMIQVRNVPDDLHRELRLRALRQGLTLSNYLLRLIEADLARPPLDEVLDRISRRPPMRLSQSPAEMIREDRDR